MMRKTCEECGGRIVRKKVEFRMYGELIGLFPAEVCTKCGEKLFDEKASDQIDAEVKKRGLWGLGVNAKLIKVGSSMAVVINQKLARFLDLKPGSDVHVHPESRHRIAIEVP